MSMMSGLAEDAKLRRLQDATKAYAVAWQAPTWPSTLAGSLLLLSLVLHRLGQARAEELVCLYTPLIWAAAQRLAFRSWTPPLGQVQGAFGIHGSWPRAERWLLTFSLALTNVGASVSPVLGANGSLATLGALALLWAGKALPGAGVAVVFGAGGPTPNLEPHDLLGFALRMTVATGLLLIGIIMPFVRRKALERLARATAEMGTAEKLPGIDP